VLLSPSTSAVTRLQLLALPASELRHLTPPKNITTGPDAVAFKEQWAGYLPIKGSSTDGVHVLVLDPALSTPVELPPNAWVLPTEGSTQRRDVDAASTMIEHPAAPVRSVNPLKSPVPLAPPPSAPPPWWITDSKRAARAKNVSLVPTSDAAGGRWAYEVLDPRPGTVLLSAGQSASGQPYLEDAAVLLVHVCACHPAVFGVLLSAPTASLMGGEFCPTARAHYSAFVNHTVHMGGPVGPHWTVLHSFPTSGSTAVRPGLHVGGCLSDAQRKVEAGGAALASEVIFISGYLAFPLDRLQADLEQGRWKAAAVSTDLIFEELKVDGGAHMREAVLKAMR